MPKIVQVEPDERKQNGLFCSSSSPRPTAGSLLMAVAAREMEVQYAEIVYVELKRNIHIPNDWPIQGIEGLVLYLAEKIISDFGSCILQVNNVPAKLIRRGCVNVFEKVAHEKVEGSHLYDVLLKDDREVRVEIFSGENQEYCATASTSKKEMPYHTIPRCLKEKLRSTANDPVLRRTYGK